MISIDPGSATPPFEQIRVQIADLIGAGDLSAEQRLPTVRQLAADLQVAPGTVAKAYALLEGEGLLVTNRSKGTHVAPGRRHARSTQDAAQHYVAAVKGVDLDQALSAVRAAWVAAQRTQGFTPRGAAVQATSSE